VPKAAEVGVGRGMEAVAAAIASAVSIPRGPCGDDTGSGVDTDAVRLQAVIKIKSKLKDSSFPSLVMRPVPVY
jgi:hypothetical protein